MAWIPFAARYDGILAKSVPRGLCKCCLVCVYSVVYILECASVIKPNFRQKKKELNIIDLPSCEVSVYILYASEVALEVCESPLAATVFADKV
jgi:hypothetical protein